MFWSIAGRRGSALTLLAAVAVLGVLSATGTVHARADQPRRPAPSTAAPAAPPAQICGDYTILDGPASAPAGATTLPAGDNESLIPSPNTTYWFAPGVHTLGTSEWGQIIAADGDVFVGGPGAVLDGQHLNRYAFTQRAVNVTIKHLTIRNFGAAGADRDEGVVNHDSGHGWKILDNTVRDNAGAGVFIGTDDIVRYNCLLDNGQYGFSAYEAGGDANIVLDHNEIAGNNTYDWEAHLPGCGCVGGGKFWNVNRATVTNNWVHDNHGPALWADTDNNDFDIEHNYLAGNDGEGVEYEISYNALIRNNTFVGNAVAYGAANPGFPTGAVYLSESGGDARVPARYTTITVTGNQFVNNWSGVVLWENADRFCGSPANTSGSYCTLVNPSVVNISTCVATTIDQPPYYADCRWKTQNVAVRQNSFTLDPAAVDGCATAVSCGLQGLFSNYGTYPSWSPYQGEIVEQAITFAQNDHFNNNTYTGPWRFMAHDQGTVLDRSAWQAAPYRQDTASTFTPSAGAQLDRAGVSARRPAS